MAVYERTYRRYTGPTTPQAVRFAILPRYAFRDVFKSRLFLGFYILSFIMPLWCAAAIYLSNNASFLKLFPEFDLSQIFAIDAKFFFTFLMIQAWGAFLVTVFVGPRLLSRDMANNALPLYLSRPLSRFEYLFGKSMVLAALLSAMTWIAGLFLILLHTNFQGLGWFFDNLRLPIGVFVGSWIWIATLSLLALAAGSWARYRSRAGFAMVIIVLGGSALGEAINALFGTTIGQALDLLRLMLIIWGQLLGVEASSETISAPTAWIALGLFLAACMAVLYRKLRAYEVVT